MGGQKKDVDTDAHLLGGTAIKPVGWDRKGMEAFQYMLYNPDTGEILTRTPLSWALITGFYIIYYGLLVCFWAACLNIFFLTLPEPENGPRWQQDRIGKTPGVGMRPHPTDERIDSQMFYLKRSDPDETPTNNLGEGDKNIDYAVRLRNYREKHYNDSKGPLGTEGECSANIVRAENQDPCKFDFEGFGECDQYPYGFTSKGEEQFVNPCIFLKLNKIWGWDPSKKVINKADLKTMKEEDLNAMTDGLKKIIESGEVTDQIWIDCKGRNAADQEHVKFTYYPETQGIPIKYFPYMGGNYQAPVVAVQLNLNNPKDFGQLIHVECRAWYKDLKHNARDKKGMFMFEMMLDHLEKDYHKD